MNLQSMPYEVVNNFSDYYVLLIKKLNTWFTAFVVSIPNMIAVIAVIIVFYFLSRLMGNGSKKVLAKITTSPNIIKLTSLILRWLTISIGIVICLEVLNLEKAVFSLLAGAGILGIALGFAFQDLAANFIAGFYLAFVQLFKEGDLIKTGEYVGTVLKLNIRNTSLMNSEGQTITIPNRMIFEKPLVNYHKSGKRRMEIKLGVSYEQDLSHATQIIEDSIKSLDYVLKTEEILVAVTQFGGLSMNFIIQFWIKYPNPNISSDLAIDRAIKLIKNNLDKEEINIPYTTGLIDLGNRSYNQKIDYPIIQNNS